jgi:hypothetical protein
MPRSQSKAPLPKVMCLSYRYSQEGTICAGCCSYAMSSQFNRMTMASGDERTPKHGRSRRALWLAALCLLAASVIAYSVIG